MFKFKTPQADKILYDAMLKKGFEIYPKRYENYQKYLENKKSLKPNFMPIKADIENVGRCNFRCAHCIASTYTNSNKIRDLGFDVFKKFIDAQFGLIEVKVQGIGEPFLDKDFTKMIEFASNKFIWTRSTSNASLLHLNDNYKKIIDANIGELQISIDGATAEVFEAIRLGGKFDRVTKNCILLNEYANQISKNPKTRMWSVLQNKNFHQAKDLVKLAKDLGFKRITLSVELRGWEGYKDISEFTQKQKISDNGLNQEWFNDLSEFADGIGIDLSFWYAATRFNAKNPCFWPFERLFLSSDGFIVPCCTICDPKVYNYGKIEDFDRIWFNDERLTEFRRAHLGGGGIPKICLNCYGD